jgi:glutathione reductase (NADPH)
MGACDYDLFVIGAGSAGVRASRVAAGFGARVAVAEERRLGGTCVNVGCIPKKLLVYASQFREDFEVAEAYGWTLGAPRFEWKRLLENKNREIARLNQLYAGLLDDAGVERIEGQARLLDAHTVVVGERRVRAETILVATGSWPELPRVPGIEHAITSNEAFFLDEVPRTVLIVGGGYVAAEFAGILHGLGARVTQLYRGALFLRGFDDDLRSGLADEMRRKGIDLRFGANPARLERTAGGVRAVLEDGGVLEAEKVLYATGRRPHTEGFGLAEAGVELDGCGAVRVDEYSRSSVPNIWAVGDCTNRLNLTPVAIHEGNAFARTVFGGEPTRPDYDFVPTAIFSQPNVGTVGLGEAQARERFGEIDVYRSSFRPLKLSLTDLEERVRMKLVVERSSQRVVGCHVLGPDAGEIVQGFAVALKCGATKAHFDATLGIHPTSAEEFVTMRQKVTEA